MMPMSSSSLFSKASAISSSEKANRRVVLDESLLFIVVMLPVEMPSMIRAMNSNDPTRKYDFLPAVREKLDIRCFRHSLLNERHVQFWGRHSDQLVAATVIDTQKNGF